MQTIMNFLEEKMTPIAIKLDRNRYVTAIKDGFLGCMSLLIIGSFFLLLANFPITGYPEFMQSILGDNWANYFTVPFEFTMNIMTLYVIIAMAYSLAKHYELDGISCISSVIAAFFILTPMYAFSNADYGSGIPMNNLGASGLFVGMITAALTIELVNFSNKKGWKIKMPDSVPENVSQSFSALIPALIVIVIFNFIRIGFSFTSYETVQQFIFENLQTPLTSLGASLPATIIVLIFEGFLWSFGIHGSNIVGGIMQPIWLTLTADNNAAFQAGNKIPHIVNYQFYNNFVKVGGAGGTIGLAILLLLLSKSDQFKALSKLAIGPSLFGINEPIAFGLPIVLNPIMIIPYILTPIVLCLVAYFSMSWGLVPYTNGTNIPWTTPPIISGFLISGWQGAVLNVVQIIISMFIYLPFFKMADNIAYKREQELKVQEQTA